MSRVVAMARGLWRLASVVLLAVSPAGGPSPAGGEVLARAARPRPRAAGPLAGVLVASEAADTVIVLDPLTLRAREILSFGSSVPGERMPHRLAVTPDGKQLLVTLYGHGALAVFDVASRELTAEIPVGRDPHGVAVSPDGRYAYVAASASKALSIVDLAERRLVSQVPMPLLPWDVVVSNDGATAWVTSIASQLLAEVDLSRSAARPAVDVGEPYVVAAATLPDGRLVVGGHSSNRLMVLDPASRQIVGRPQLGGAPVVVDRSDARASFSCQVVPRNGSMPVALRVRTDESGLVAIAHGTDDLVMLDLPGLGVRERIPVGRDPQDVALSPDGSRAYVSSGADGELWAVDLDTLAPVGRTRVGARPIGVLVLPDTRAF